jgi:hypothetical protein
VRTTDGFRMLKPKRRVDGSGDGYHRHRNNRRRTDVAQTAAMLAGMMSFLLVRIGCRLRAEGGAEDEKD